MTKDAVLAALDAYDAGNPEPLRELNEQLETPATVSADTAMAISNNPVGERERLLSNAGIHGLLTTSEMLGLALPDVVRA